MARHVSREWRAGHGGWVLTANVDILRAVTRNAGLADLTNDATLVVADGMPLLWAARLAGDELPERVTGSSLVFSLSAAAADEDRSVFLLGGDDGVPERAAAALRSRFPTLRIAGTDAPPVGFDSSEAGLARVLEVVADARPDLVFVGLGFPKQERLIVRLREIVPDAWYVGCGAGIPIAAGVFRRAPAMMQRLGMEWVHRLALEPRRLAQRYLRDDLSFTLRLLAHALLRRWRGTSGVRPGR